MNKIDEKVLNELVEEVFKRFYQRREKKFYAERKMLMYVLSWPAQWMSQRALMMDCKSYANFIIERLEHIERHADKTAISKYPPRYLLKCFQQYLQHDEDQLYEKFKKISNNIERLLFRIEQDSYRQSENCLEILSSIHQIMKHPKRKSKEPPGQMKLF